jgi:hypothetical protein
VAEGHCQSEVSFVIGFWLSPAFLSLGLGVFLPYCVSVELLMYSYDKYIQLSPMLHFKQPLVRIVFPDRICNDVSKKIHTFPLYSESAVINMIIE